MPAPFSVGQAGVLHGMRSYLLQDEDGNVQIAHSISAGLDYPGVGPEHAYLHDSGRAHYVSITDDEAMGSAAGAVYGRRNHPGHRERPRSGLRI